MAKAHNAENDRTMKTWNTVSGATMIPAAPSTKNPLMVAAIEASTERLGRDDQKCWRSRTINTLN